MGIFSFFKKASKPAADELVTVGEFNNEMSAEIAKASLLSAGIAAITEGTTSSYPNINMLDPILLKVNKADEELARKILEDPQTESQEKPQE